MRLAPVQLGLSYTSGTQVLTLTDEDTWALSTLGSGAGQVLSREAGDGLYAALSGATFSGAISATNLSGTNSGDQTITLTGDVTGSGTGSFAATIGDGTVTLGKMANLAANSLVGNNTEALAAPLALTGTQVTAMLDTFGTTTKGLVPPPSTSTGKFLKDDGTWGVAVDNSAFLNRYVGDGTTTAFLMDQSVTAPEDIIVTINGLRQDPTTDYTVSGATLTITPARQATDTIIVERSGISSGGGGTKGYGFRADSGAFTMGSTILWTHTLDEVGLHDNSTNTDRITFPVDGFFSASCHTADYTNTTGLYMTTFRLYDSGGTVIQSQTNEVDTSGGEYMTHAFNGPVSAGDYLVVDTSGTRDTDAANISGIFFTETGAGAGVLDNLVDVDTTTIPPTDGQALVYDTTSGMWLPGNVAAGGGAGGLKLLGEVVAAGGETSLQVGSIPEGHGTLVIEILGRTAASENVTMTFNNDTTAKYDYARGYAGPTQSQLDNAANQTAFPSLTLLANAASGGGRWSVPFYDDTNNQKVMFGQGFQTSRHVNHYGGTYKSTNAITSVEVKMPTTTFVANTVFRVYGTVSEASGAGGITSDIPTAASFPVLRDNITGTFSVTDAADGGDGVHFTMANTGGRTNGMLGVSVGAGPWEVECGMWTPLQTSDNWWWWGLGAMDTSSEQVVSVMQQMEGSGISAMRVQSYWNPDFSSVPTSVDTVGPANDMQVSMGQHVRFKIVNDQTNLKTYISLDFGSSWQHVGTHPVSAFTNGPTIVGIFAGSTGSSGTTKTFCNHFKVT